MDEKLLNLLEENARLSNKDLAAALGVSEQEVKDEIKLLEDTGVIKAYKTKRITITKPRMAQTGILPSPF